MGEVDPDRRIEIRQASDPAVREAAFALRHVVFCGEQGVSADIEFDGRDDEALQLVAIRDAEVVGTCRLLAGDAELRLGRMAVARPMRRRGVAAALLAEAERQARATGAERIVLGAQLSARSVYEHAGYLAHGDVYLDAGIEHVEMSKQLD